MTKLHSSIRRCFNSCLSHSMLFSSLNLSEFLAWIGFFAWVYFTFEGYIHYDDQVPHKKAKTGGSVLVYGTYFCIPEGDEILWSKILVFSITQLFIYIGVLVGVSKAHKQLLVLSWTLMCGFLIIRLHRFILSDCSWNWRVILHLIYAIVEIWFILMFVIRVHRDEQSLREHQSRIIQTHLDLQNWLSSSGSQNLNQLEITANNNTSITNCSNSTTDLPPAYDEIVGSCNHPTNNDGSTGCLPFFVYLDTSTDLPPSYEDCLTTDSTKHLCL